MIIREEKTNSSVFRAHYSERAHLQFTQIITHIFYKRQTLRI
jgi:hypothetical protein